MFFTQTPKHSEKKHVVPKSRFTQIIRETPDSQKSPSLSQNKSKEGRLNHFGFLSKNYRRSSLANSKTSNIDFQFDKVQIFTKNHNKSVQNEPVLNEIRIKRNEFLLKNKKLQLSYTSLSKEILINVNETPKSSFKSNEKFTQMENIAYNSTSAKVDMFDEHYYSKPVLSKDNSDNNNEIKQNKELDSSSGSKREFMRINKTALHHKKVNFSGLVDEKMIYDESPLYNQSKHYEILKDNILKANYRRNCMHRSSTIHKTSFECEDAQDLKKNLKLIQSYSFLNQGSDFKRKNIQNQYRPQDIYKFSKFDINSPYSNSIRKSSSIDKTPLIKSLFLNPKQNDSISSSLVKNKMLTDPSNKIVKKTKLDRTINHSCTADRSSRREFVISLCENRSRQVGFCAFSSFSARIIIGTIIDNMLYENTLLMLNRIFPIEVFLPENHKESVLFSKINSIFAESKVSLLSTKFYNETTGFSIYKATRNFKIDFELDKNYLAFGALSSLHYVFNENCFESQNENIFRNPHRTFDRSSFAGFEHGTNKLNLNLDSRSNLELQRMKSLEVANLNSLAKNSENQIIYETLSDSEKSENQSNGHPREKPILVNAKSNDYLNPYRQTVNSKKIKFTDTNFNMLSRTGNSFKSSSNRENFNNCIETDEFMELDFKLLSIEIYEPDKYLFIDHHSIKDLELLQNLENGSSAYSLFSIFKCRTSAGIRYLRASLCQPLKEFSEIEKRLEIIQLLKNSPNLYTILHRRLNKLNKSDNLALRFLKRPNLFSDAALLKFYNTLTDLYFFLREYNELHRDLSSEIDRLRSTSKGNDSLLSIFLKESAHSESLLILQTLENHLDFSLTKNQNNRKDNFLFLLKNSSDIFIELSKHSYSRLYENMLELFETYKDKVSSSGVGELLLTHTLIRGYHLKIKLSNNKSFKGNEQGKLEKNIQRFAQLNNHSYFQFPNKRVKSVDNESCFESNIKENSETNFQYKKEDSTNADQPSRFRSKLNKQEYSKIQKDDLSQFEAKISSILNEGVIFCQWKNKTLKFTTPSFSSINSRIDKCSKEILYQTVETISAVFNSIQNKLFFIIDLNHWIAYTDLLISFTEISLTQPFTCRPQFLNTRFKCLKIEKSINPIFFISKTVGSLSIKSPLQMVMQDFFIYCIRNIKMLIAPNDSGKTLYLKHISFLVILAQNGCFLPCHRASMTIFDRLTVKLNIHTSTENSISNFKQELLFIDRAIDIMKDGSKVNLILIDEFAKSTNPQEIVAYTETFVNIGIVQPNNFVIMTSVHTSLNELSNRYPSIQFLTFSKFSSRVMGGITEINNIGPQFQFFKKNHLFWKTFGQMFNQFKRQSEDCMKVSNYFSQLDTSVELFFQYLFNNSITKEALLRSVNGLLKEDPGSDI
jgi:DNA mismatch repair ATPase MutS